MQLAWRSTNLPSGDLLGAAMPNVRYKKTRKLFQMQKRAKNTKRENKRRETIHQTPFPCDLLLPRVERFSQPPAECERGFVEQVLGAGPKIC